MPYRRCVEPVWSPRNLSWVLRPFLGERGATRALPALPPSPCAARQPRCIVYSTQPMLRCMYTWGIFRENPQPPKSAKTYFC